MRKVGASTYFFVSPPSQGSPSSRAFYFKARRNLWIQATALCGVGCFPVLVIATKRLTMIGRSTPIILETLQVKRESRFFVWTSAFRQVSTASSCGYVNATPRRVLQAACSFHPAHPRRPPPAYALMSSYVFVTVKCVHDVALILSGQILTGHGCAIMFSSATSFDRAPGMKRNSVVDPPRVPWSRRISAVQMGVVSRIASEAAPSTMIARIKSMNPTKGKGETTEPVQAEAHGELSNGSYRRSDGIEEDAIEVVPFVPRNSGSFGAHDIRHLPHPKPARVIPISMPLTAISVSSGETSTSSMTAGRN